MKIILGSNSPRRKELLETMGFQFSVAKIDCDEIFPDDLPTEQVAEYLSKLKANAYKEIKNDEILITADTVVAIENEILGKPKDKQQATEMLKKLSGKTHEVYTAFTIKTNTTIISKTSVAHVTVLQLSPSEIDFYLENYQPYDKAGSYGVQEWFGMTKIASINGSYYTIMGLPTHEIYPILKDFSQKI